MLTSNQRRIENLKDLGTYESEQMLSGTAKATGN